MSNNIKIKVTEYDENALDLLVPNCKKFEDDFFS
jgi:hypothetical protein